MITQGHIHSVHSAMVLGSPAARLPKTYREVKQGHTHPVSPWLIVSQLLADPHRCTGVNFHQRHVEKLPVTLMKPVLGAGTQVLDLFMRTIENVMILHDS